MLAEQGWEAGVDALLERSDPASLTFVVPLWSGAVQRLDPRWIGRVLTYVRGRSERFAGRAWGLLPGVDAAALSLAVARAILAEAIVAAYAREPAAMFVTSRAEAVGSQLPGMPADVSAHRSLPLQLVDLDHVCAETSLAVCERRWSALYMSGHGRSYCGQLGHLCGARALSVAPDAPAPHCVGGLACVSPVDGLRVAGQPAFPRIDPRRYDAPIMILESCVAGGWASPEWSQGTPAIAIHAFAGAASAVICSDFATMVSAADHVEPLAALRDAATIGEALARLNGGQPEDMGGVVRYLIGDPELRLDFPGWAGWAAAPLEQARSREPELQVVLATCTRAAPFIELELGLGEVGETTTQVLGEIGGAHLVDAQGVPRLWVAPSKNPKSESEDEVEAPLELRVEARATPRLPPGLLDAALLTPLLTRSWTPELRVHALPLTQAAARISAVAERLDLARGRVMVGDGEQLRACVPLVRQAWLEAHLAAVRAACDLADRGMREEQLWRGVDYRSVTIEEPCPYCGLAPTLERHYRSPPALARTQWECISCTVICDWPSVPGPRVSLTMPGQIEAGQTLEARLDFDNSDNDRHVAIAGALLVVRDGHSVEGPPPFAMELGPGERSEQRVVLRSTGRPAIAHRYYARAPILVNGAWTLATRLLEVRP